MCEISFVKPVGRKIDENDIKQIASIMGAGSFLNKDGYGLTNGVRVFKRDEQFSSDMYKSFVELFVGSSFLIGHTRLKTSGAVKKLNSHPFYNKRFIWVHNGIIHNFSEVCCDNNIVGVNVDSELIGLLLYRECKDDVDADVAGAIRSVMKMLSGNVSVFVFDCLTKRLFYFRNDGCDFDFVLLQKGNDFVLVGCTDEYNIRYCYNSFVRTVIGFEVMEYSRVAFFKPVANIIYEVSDAGFINVGTFKNSVYASWYDNVAGYYGGYGLTSYGGKGYQNNDDIDDVRHWDIGKVEKLLFNYFNSDVTVKRDKKDGKKRFVVCCNRDVHDEILMISGVDVDYYLMWEDVEVVADTVFDDMDRYKFGDDVA